MGKKEGQIILDKEEEGAEGKKKVKIRVKFEVKRILFYIVAAILIYLLLSYSYKLILAYEDFYHLTNTYSHTRQNNVLVITPRAGDVVNESFNTRGKARTYNNSLIAQVRDHSTGEVVHKEEIEVSYQKEQQYGDFSTKIKKLNLPLKTTGNIVLEFYLESTDGVKSSLVTIPLQLK